MKARLLAYAVAAAIALLSATGCGDADAPEQATAGPQTTAEAAAPASGTSEMARAGERVFNANCSICHGVAAVGTKQGPPLTDGVYHPGHHPDASFRNAVRNGVQSHHWGFGDMAPVPGVSPDEVEQVICFVRQTQRANGLFEGNEFSTVC